MRLSVQLQSYSQFNCRLSASRYIDSTGSSRAQQRAAKLRPLRPRCMPSTRPGWAVPPLPAPSQPALTSPPAQTAGQAAKAQPGAPAVARPVHHDQQSSKPATPAAGEQSTPHQHQSCGLACCSASRKQTRKVSTAAAMSVARHGSSPCEVWVVECTGLVGGSRLIGRSHALSTEQPAGGN